jgi:hypothetical protein
MLEELFQFTQKYTTMAEARSTKWKTLRKKIFILFLKILTAYASTAYVQTTWRILCVTPSRSTTHRHSDMVGNWWMVAVALSTTRDQLCRRI